MGAWIPMACRSHVCTRTYVFIISQEMKKKVIWVWYRALFASEFSRYVCDSMSEILCVLSTELWFFFPTNIWNSVPRKSESKPKNSCNFNPYPWILEKIQNAGPSPSVFSGKKIRSAALNQFVYVSVLWIFFPGNCARWRSQKWHIFLFSAAYFLYA